jgi:hypothetical protein
MLVTSRTSHTKIGYIPEFRYVLLRDNTTKKLELWTQSRGRELQAINLDGVELEYVREIRSAYRVPDTEYNRTHCPHEIGRIYVDDRPIGAEVQVLG